MISLLARSRVFIVTLLLATLTLRSNAIEDSLFTSSVTYCNPPESLLIQRFEVAYFPANTSVSFNVSASSVEPNVNVTANVFLNVYGMKPFNMTIDLCNILKGALCPLPMYNFTGADSIQLPSKLNLAQRIPEIAFKIPDLEGFAQLTLTEVGTGRVKACVQATLSNVWSARQEAVSWTTALLALFTFLAAGASSIFSPEAILPFRLLDLIYLYQSIAISALLNLNYPSVYRSFALNFAWALGLISSAESPVQSAIARLRHSTGGQMSDISANNAVGFVNRKDSPFNYFAKELAVLVGGITSSVRTAVRDTVNGEVETVTPNSPNVLQAGVPIYVNLLGIATANAFMTVFIITLCLLAISLVVVASSYAGVLMVRRRRSKRSGEGQMSEFDYPSLVISWYLRMALGLATPLTTFIFYQWTLRDSWLSVLFSVISLLALSAAIIYPSVCTCQLVRNDSPSALYRPSRHFSRFSSLYARYRQERYWFFIPVLSAVVLRSIFIAFAKSSGPAQVALMIVVELGLVLSHFVLKPSSSRASHVFTTYLAVTRFVCTIMMIAFLEDLQVMAIPRVVVGIAIALIWIASFFVVVGNIAWNIVLSIRRRSASATSSDSSSKESMIEKGGGNSMSTREKDSNGNSSSSSLEQAEASHSRPTNPTPDHNVPLDPTVIQPYPFSPTVSTISSPDPPTTSQSSVTLTLGSELPSRWNLNSQPASPSNSNQDYSAGQGRRSSEASSCHPEPSPSLEGDNHADRVGSRNASVRMQQHHEDIKEENEDDFSR